MTPPARPWTGGRAARPGNHTWRRIAAWAVGAATVDGLTKLIASRLAHVSTGGHVTDVHNAGLSMSVAPGGSPLLVWLALLALLSFGGWVAVLGSRGSIPAWMPGLLIGGAAANLADRIAFGAVHDWLRVGFVVLNLADLAILVAGIGVLVSSSSLAHRTEPRPPATDRT